MSNGNTILNHPHRRKNILTEEWILVSPHRNNRPWQGQQDAVSVATHTSHDKECYLCSGNKRNGGHQNPNYSGVYVFTNDFSALVSDEVLQEEKNEPFFIQKSERGICKVICFSPRHDLTLAEMDLTSINHVVDEWCKLYSELGELPYVNYVQIFENKGAIMGCSNPHPHGQVWAQENIPMIPEKESINFLAYYIKNKTSLLADYLVAEQKKKERIVLENDYFAVLVPFWASWPFETIIIPKRQIRNFGDMNEKEKWGFADALQKITCRYDNLFECSFPYSSGIHQSPTDGEEHPEWHFHMHFYPPLLRSATIKKFMVGYEMMCEPQRDITPEICAEILRKLPDQHYSQIN